MSLLLYNAVQAQMHRCSLRLALAVRSSQGACTLAYFILNVP
jgi:hypothetical protein